MSNIPNVFISENRPVIQSSQILAKHVLRRRETTENNALMTNCAQLSSAVDGVSYYMLPSSDRLAAFKCIVFCNLINCCR
jgi:hypothetical protein